MDDADILRRALRESADEDVAGFISSLDQDETTGVPPPPKIEITEVSSEPAQFDLMPFGAQAAETTPSGAGVPPPPPPPPTTCDPSSPGTDNLTFFDSVTLTLHVHGDFAHTECFGDPTHPPLIWSINETVTRTLTREDRDFVTPIKPIGDHFQLWLDTGGFEHFELPDTIDCFNCFGGWTSCTAAFQVGMWIGERVNLCPAGYIPDNGGQVFFAAAQFTWFNESPVSGWSDGNELQFYYWGPSELYVCTSGPPDYNTCNSIGTQVPSGVHDVGITGKDLANLPGSYNYVHTWQTSSYYDPGTATVVPLYLTYDFSIDIV